MNTVYCLRQQKYGNIKATLVTVVYTCQLTTDNNTLPYKTYLNLNSFSSLITPKLNSPSQLLLLLLFNATATTTFCTHF